MTAESGDIETCSEYIEEAKRMGFTILPPDINESFSDFTVVVEEGIVTKNIRFGLGNIKTFGNEIGKAIIAERKAGGHLSRSNNFSSASNIAISIKNHWKRSFSRAQWIAFNGSLWRARNVVRQHRATA